MSEMKNKISELAEEFSEGVLAAIRGASLEELLGEGGGSSAPARRGRPPGPAKIKADKPEGSSGRLARRSPEQIEATIQSIVGALKKAPDGLGSEQLQQLLSIEKREIASPLIQALEAKVLRKEGNKRATRYFIAVGGSSSKKVTKSPKKAAAKMGKTSKKTKKSAAKKAPKKKAEKAPEAKAE
jgi:hypothetical protein